DKKETTRGGDGLEGGKGRPHINLARCLGFLDWSNIELKNHLGTIELGTNLFGSEEAAAILRIPLAQHQQDDSRIWSGEPLGEYTVRSDYRWLTKEEPNLDSIHYRRNMPSGIVLQYKNIWKELGIQITQRDEEHLGNLVKEKQDPAREKSLISGGHSFSYLQIYEGMGRGTPQIIGSKDSRRTALFVGTQKERYFTVDWKSIIESLRRLQQRLWPAYKRKRNKTAHATAQEALKLNRSTYMEGQLLRPVITPAVKDARDLELS
ncbi:hypothetical protein Gotur_000587, partial [Gossypium turneri]